MNQPPQSRSFHRALRRFAPPGLAALLAVISASPGSGQPPKEPEEDRHGHHGHHSPPADGAGDHRSHGKPFQCHDRHHDFSDAERWTGIFDSPERQDWQRPHEVIALMEIEAGMTAADLGAGTGYFLAYLSPAVGTEGRVLALEPEASLVEFIKKRASEEGWTNVKPRRIPYDDPQLDAGSVDRLLIVNTWHHIEDRPAYAAKIRQALKSDGKVYVVDYTQDSPSGPPREERLEPEQIIDELTRGGLASALVEEALPRQFIVVGRRDDR
ncbi:MAG: methyltransferase domain-containing protein [bacterium]|nr:methyltransferase domain-containing protein [bacterium]